MSMKYLGERFDIHTGGTDLRFPHHEDEIAQSEGAVGHPVVSIWVHAGHLRQAGQKIAKSTGNVVSCRDLCERGYRPAGVPMALLPDAVPLGDGLHMGRDVRPQTARAAAPAAHGRMGPAVDELGEAGEPSTCGFARRSRTTSTCPASWPSSTSSTARRDVPDRREVRRCSRRGTTCSGSTSSARRARGGSRASETWRMVAARDAAREPRRTSRRRIAFATNSTAMGLEVMDTPEGTKVRPSEPVELADDPRARAATC